MDQTLITKIRDSFARQNMMATLQATLSEVADGRVVITAPILDITTQQHGFAHAGVPFSLGDSAAGYAGMTALRPDQEIMTAEIKMNCLAPAKGDSLRATGTIIRPGRRLIVVTAQVHSLEGDKETLVALLQGTMVPV